MIRALIFDFDGLILDTETAEYVTWQEIYAEHERELPLPVWQTAIGTMDAFDPVAYLQGLVERPLDRPTLITRHRQTNLARLAHYHALPGVLDYLDDAEQLGLKVGIASSSDRAWLTQHLTRLGLLERFAVIRGRDDVNNVAKPAPDVYLAAAAALGVAPHEVLALEDSTNGSLAAKRAGMWCVAVPNRMTQSLNFDHVDLRLNSLAEMPLAQVLAYFERNVA